MQIEYLCFHADRISFVPSKDQVIFFTPKNRYYRMGLSLINYVDENYVFIEDQFHRKGLEFVFLPKTTKELNIPELYKYFRPDADEKDIPFLTALVRIVHVLYTKVIKCCICDTKNPVREMGRCDNGI